MARAHLGRRHLMLASAAAAGTAIARPALAARKAGPGGFSAERLARIPVELQKQIDDGTAVGIVTLIQRRGEVVQVNTLGHQDREANLAMKRDTIFRLASMTKPVTCATALTLVDAGKMSLNDPIAKWIPEFANARVLNKADGPLNETHPAPRGIIVSDLLTHRPGIGGGTTASGPLAQALGTMAGERGTAEEWLKRLSAIPLAYDPGTQWVYGYSHDVLGALIQRVSGRPFGEYMKAALLDPLGMKDTGFWQPKEKHPRVAQVYGRDETGKRVPAGRPVPEAPPAFPSGSGALSSTVDDYAKFARMLLGYGTLGEARVLSRPIVSMMRSNWLTPEQRKLPGMGNPDFWNSQGFGLGIAITDDIARLGPMPYGSPGAFTWAGATGVWWQADPVEDLVAMYFVQNASGGSVNPRPGTVTTPTPMDAVRQGMARFYAPMTTFSRLIYDAIDT